MRASKILTYTAFTLVALFGLLAATFIIGEAFMDPGGWAAVWMSAAWVVPVLGLSAFALLRPGVAESALALLTAAVVLFALADAVLGIIPRDDWGPVAGIALFALCIPLAFLGLHRALLAGALIVAAELGALVNSPAGVALLPLLLVGGLYIAAGRLEGDALHWHLPPTAHPAA